MILKFFGEIWDLDFLWIWVLSLNLKQDFLKNHYFCTDSLIDSFIPNFLRCGKKSRGNLQFSWIKSCYSIKCFLKCFFCLRLNSFGNGMDPTSVDPPLAAGLGNFDDYDLHSDLLNDFLDGEVISKKKLLVLYQKF